tara:strand:- start:2243 stop:2638 length:396 start_codon:yes stop_codon:yes gene_type:complete
MAYDKYIPPIPVSTRRVVFKVNVNMTNLSLTRVLTQYSNNLAMYDTRTAMRTGAKNMVISVLPTEPIDTIEDTTPLFKPLIPYPTPNAAIAGKTFDNPSVTNGARSESGDHPPGRTNEANKPHVKKASILG